MHAFSGGRLMLVSWACHSNGVVVTFIHGLLTLLRRTISTSLWVFAVFGLHRASSHVTSPGSVECCLLDLLGRHFLSAFFQFFHLSTLGIKIGYLAKLLCHPCFSCWDLLWCWTGPPRLWYCMIDNFRCAKTKWRSEWWVSPRPSPQVVGTVRSWGVKRYTFSWSSFVLRLAWLDEVIIHHKYFTNLTLAFWTWTNWINLFTVRSVNWWCTASSCWHQQGKTSCRLLITRPTAF